MFSTGIQKLKITMNTSMRIVVRSGSFSRGEEGLDVQRVWNGWDWESQSGMF